MPPYPSFLCDRFDNPEFSDLTIRCHGRDFAVHKTIVCPQSSYLHAAMKHGMEEQVNSLIVLEEHEVEVVRAVLHYLYRGTYDFETYSAVDGTEMSALEFHVRVFLAADYFDVPTLQHEASTRYRTSLGLCCFQNSVWRTKKLLCSHFIRSVAFLYQQMPEPQNEIQLEIQKTVMQTARAMPTATKAAIKDLLQDHPSFSTSVALGFIGVIDTLKQSQPAQASPDSSPEPESRTSSSWPRNIQLRCLGVQEHKQPAETQARYLEARTTLCGRLPGCYICDKPLNLVKRET
ncbi:MAG: hypothetical protein M1828_001306 [Chrysothrix sp. TS-e1954]|nr:MAG: hypothetical protein M1828_001306 [Chrysothrix sp. TS-e1954]